MKAIGFAMAALFFNLHACYLERFGITLRMGTEYKMKFIEGDYRKQARQRLTPR